MLNFCPNLLCEALELHKATREFLFLVDRSGSMSGTKIHSVKVGYKQELDCYRFKHRYWSFHPILCPQEAMVIALKSLPSGTKLNIVGFGTTIKPLFTSSKLCTDVRLRNNFI